MKKYLKFVAYSVLLVLGMSACSSGGNTALTKSAAENALEESSFFAKDSKLMPFQTGYYEVTLDQLSHLAKLQAAKMITLRVDELTELKRRNWYGNLESVDHYFAAVELTDEGKKFEKEPFVYKPSYLKKYLAANEEYAPTLPEYLSATYVPKGTKKDGNTGATDANGSGSHKSNTHQSRQTSEQDEQVAAVNEEYNKAKARINTVDHLMLLCQFKLEKVYEVKSNLNPDKADTGTCKLIYQFEDLTPFAYVYYTVTDTQYRIASASFSRYEDLGWTVTDIDTKH